MALGLRGAALAWGGGCVALGGRRARGNGEADKVEAAGTGTGRGPDGTRNFGACGVMKAQAGVAARPRKLVCRGGTAQRHGCMPSEMRRDGGAAARGTRLRCRLADGMRRDAAQAGPHTCALMLRCGNADTATAPMRGQRTEGC